MQQKKGKVLLAEDDLSLGFMMKATLEEEHYEVEYCRNGQEAIDRFDKNEFDICLLDIMMPQKDGFAVAKKIRQQSDVIPILYISTKVQEEDRIKGYHTGADDYIGKPFSMNELLLKMEVFLRRSKKTQADSNWQYQLGTLLFDYNELRLNSGKEMISLTEKEAELLRFLCEHFNKVLRREEILLHVWGKDDFFLGRSMDVYITRLRKFLKADQSIILETIYGIGFRLTVSK